MMKCVLRLLLCFEITFVLTDNSGFPLHELIQEKKTFLATYGKRNLCNGSTTTASETTCCSCAKDCMKKGMCCIDAFWDSSKYVDVRSYIDVLLNMFSQRKELCTSRFLFEKRENIPSSTMDTFGFDRSYIVIDFCKKGADINVTKKCTSEPYSLQDSVPAFGDDNFIYKNMHCAKCNDVASFQIVPFRLQCLFANPRRSCAFEIASKSIRELSMCSNSFINPCNVGSYNYKLCQTFNGPVSGARNYFCLFCSYHSKRLYWFPDHCVSSEYEIVDMKVEISHLMFRNPTERNGTLCTQENGFIDTIDGICDTFYCPEGYQAILGNCSLIVKINRQQNEVFPNNCLNTSFLYLVVSNLTESRYVENYLIRRNISNKDDIIRDTNSRILFARIVPTVPTVLTFVQSELSNITRVLSETSKLYITPNQLTSFHFGPNIFQNFGQNRVCAQPVYISNGSFSQACNTSYNGETLSHWNISLWIEIYKLSRIKMHYFSCKNLSMVCPVNTLPSKTDNDSPSQLYHQEDLSYPCSPFQEDKEKKVHHNVPKTLPNKNIVLDYISVVASFCSMLCYILIIVNLYMMEELKNVPGFCILSICVCLSGHNTLYLCSAFAKVLGMEFHSLLRQFVGFLMHVLLMMSQFLGASIAVDATTNITSIYNNPPNNRMFLRCFIVCIVSSFFIVSIGVLLRRNNIIDTAYYARIILFHAPLFILNSLSVIILAYNVLRMTFSINIFHEVLHSNRENEILITKLALKLLLVCGLSEFIGLIGVGRYKSNNIDSQHFLGLLYTLMTSMRGIILIIVFLRVKSVMNIAPPILQFLSSITRNNFDMI